MRIGVILTYDNAIDPELWEWVPPGVTVHVTRTGRPVDTTCVGGSREITRPDWLRYAADSFVDISPEIVVFGCTSGSFVSGPDGERRIRETLLEAGATRALTTTGAVMEALTALGAHRVAVGTPYDVPCTEALWRYLEASGFEAVSLVNHEPLPGKTLNDFDLEDLEHLAERAYRPDADALFLSCTALATKPLIPRLEDRFGIPVVTAVQATMWAALRTIGATPTVDDQRLFLAPVA